MNNEQREKIMYTPIGLYLSIYLSIYLYTHTYIRIYRYIDMNTISLKSIASHIYLSFTNFHSCIVCRMRVEWKKFEVNHVYDNFYR